MCSLIVVLIDGDGLIFTMERLIAGREGGKTAVADLRSAISDEATGAGVKFEHMLVMYFCRKCPSLRRRSSAYVLD